MKIIDESKRQTTKPKAVRGDVYWVTCGSSQDLVMVRTSSFGSGLYGLTNLCGGAYYGNTEGKTLDHIFDSFDSVVGPLDCTLTIHGLKEQP